MTDTTKTIAVDLDDTLNNFTETLLKTNFAYDERFSVTRPVFDEYLKRVRSGAAEDEDLLSTEYSFFRTKIHLECYRRATARPDAVAFMQWLRREHWRIVICTHRDLRVAYPCTKAWLDENGIPFDWIFRAGNKIVFCRLWGIPTLIDDNFFPIEYGGRYGVNVFYPIHDHNRTLGGDRVGDGARGFTTFDEVKSWIQR